MTARCFSIRRSGPRLRRAHLAAVVGLLVFLAPPAGAVPRQGDPTDAEGAADFRTAPLLGPGDYVDTVVAGESVWYAVLYTNDVPYDITAELRTDPPEGATFTVELIGPTLGAVASEPGHIEGTASYSAGGTNRWFVRVNLASPVEVGDEFEFDLSLSGISAGRTGACDELDDCTAATDVEEVAADIEAARGELADITTGGTVDAVQGEIDELEPRVATLEKKLELTPETPVGVVAGLGALALLAPLLAFGIRRRRSGASTSGGPAPDDPSASVGPASVGPA